MNNEKNKVLSFSFRLSTYSSITCHLLFPAGVTPAHLSLSERKLITFPEKLFTLIGVFLKEICIFEFPQ
jgi:hypothetical protein